MLSRIFGDVSTIPMAALVAVMIMVAIGAFDWHSVKPSTLEADAEERDVRDSRDRSAGLGDSQPRRRRRGRGARRVRAVRPQSRTLRVGIADGIRGWRLLLDAKNGSPFHGIRDGAP